MRHRLLALGLAATLIGCAPRPGIPLYPSGTSRTPSPEGETRPALEASLTLAATVPTATDTLPAPSATSTPEARCDVELNACILTGHFFFERPIAVPGTRTADLSYLFGTTQTGNRQPHHGVDLPNASGTQVLAAAPGQVVFAGSDMQTPVSPWSNLYGNVIILQHRFAGIETPVYSLYGHLSKVGVEVGQSVQAGEPIGAVGATGAAIGSHMHFEVRVGEAAYSASSNPALWLIPLGGTGALAGRLADVQGNLLHVTALRLQVQSSTGGQLSPARQLETYAAEKEPVSSDAALGENFALTDLRPGRYRLTLISNGRLYERWADVLPGKLTFIEIIVK